MLYRAERMADTLTNASALALFSMVCELQCRWDLALETQQLCRQMGERMKLFGVISNEPNRAHFNNMLPQMKIASAQAAWGLYNWLRWVLCYNRIICRISITNAYSLRTLFYEEQAVEYPPIMPIPGRH